MTELMERVQREDREWREARLHHALHGNWLAKDECAVCLAVYPESPYLRLTPWARDKVGPRDFEALALRAEALGYVLGALYSFRHHEWICTAEKDGKRVQLRASGPLPAILAGLLDDVECLP